MSVTHTCLMEVAEQVGLPAQYISAWGEGTQVTSTTIEKILASLGFDVANDEALLSSWQQFNRKPILEPVSIHTFGEQVEIALNLGVSARTSDFEWHLITEDGEEFSGYLQSQVIRDERSSGGPLVFAIPGELAMGYHHLNIQRKRRKTPYVMTVIVAPKQCYRQPFLEQGGKCWGPSVQLYTLKTAHNWGIGDFGDLKMLISEMASLGANFIGLNPIHALFPANPDSASPYSPSSRRWLNILYIDVSSVPEFALCAEAQQHVGSDTFQALLGQARDAHWVDYPLVTKLKLQVLPMLYAEFKARHLDNDTERAKAFHEFVEQGGDSLLSQATFDALHALLSEEQEHVWGWQVFPEEYQDYHGRAVSEFAHQQVELINLYLYMQWIADTQMQEAQALAYEKGMKIGLYRDLAVGVSNSGSSVWSDAGYLIQDMGVGAPPDVLGPLGQDWGLPPINPQALKAGAYLPFIELVRANMKHCGALRIDHILGLLRLWWVPKGESARDGAYVYYPVHELLSILALESHRQQCSVIGEDLGTVPDEMADLLANAGVHSYKVLFFEVAPDGGFYSPSHYVAQSMSALCTHDMPTLRGFWHCNDLKMGKELGLYPDQEQLDGLFDQRLAIKQAILDSVAWHGYLPDSIGRDAQYVPMDTHLMEALHAHLAAGSSSFMSIQLEDWLEMDNPVNIPGTVDEYPNWRRKLSLPLESIFSQENVTRIAARMNEIRANAG